MPKLVVPSDYVFDLPVDALAIRGGPCLVRDLYVGARKTFKLWGYPALTVFAGTDVPLIDLANRGQFEAYETIRRVNLQVLRDQGFWLSKTLGVRHFSVWLHVLTDDTIEAFRSALYEEELKPRPES